MLKTFPIEFVRQALIQTLYEEHLKESNYFGGDNQISIISFYEQLKTQDEIDRFVETYRDLTEQQNRMDLIGNGVLVSPENPTITNIYSSLIIPMSWNCSFRVRLENRDQMIETINNLIAKLKGRKCDIAQLDTEDEAFNKITKLYKVGTIGQNEGQPKIKVGDYVGDFVSTDNFDTWIKGKIAAFGQTGQFNEGDYLFGGVQYVTGTKLVTFVLNNDSNWVIYEDDGTFAPGFLPVDHTNFNKYKLSMSFDSIRCDEPRVLNAKEFCDISFGGSATLVSNGVKLGNDLLKVSFQKNKVLAKNSITFTSATIYYLEPLELPSGNNVNTTVNQLMSNNFKQNTHADAISPTLQYTFILDENNDLLNQLFDYARYGTSSASVNGISPNMIFNVSEYWCSWGYFQKKSVLGKIVENVDIENTEADTLTIGTTIQIQGENN